MRKSVRSLALAVVGVILIASSVAGQGRALVPDSRLWSIIAAGVLMAALAIVSAMRDHHVASAYRAESDGPATTPGPDLGNPAQGRSSAASRSLRRATARAQPSRRDPSRLRIGWALVASFVAFAALAPGHLGVYAGARGDGSVLSMAQSGRQVDSLPPGADGPLAELTLTAYSRLALSGDGAALRERTILLTGFVLPGDSPSSWFLTRLSGSAGAADAQPVRVEVRSAAPMAAGTWVGVTGTWPGSRGGTADAPLAVIDATMVTPVVEPGQPYENARS